MTCPKSIFKNQTGFRHICKRSSCAVHRSIRSPNGSQKTVDLPAQSLNWEGMYPHLEEKNPALVNNGTAAIDLFYSQKPSRWNQ